VDLTAILQEPLLTLFRVIIVQLYSALIQCQFMYPTTASETSLPLAGVPDNIEGLQWHQLILPSKLCLCLAKVHKGKEMLETSTDFLSIRHGTLLQQNILCVF